MAAELLLRYLFLSQGLKHRKRSLHSQVQGGRHTATTRHSLPGMWGLEPRSMHRGVCCHRSPNVCTLSHEHLRQQCAHQSRTGLWCSVASAHNDETPRSRRRVCPYSMGIFSLEDILILKAFRNLKDLVILEAFRTSIVVVAEWPDLAFSFLSWWPRSGPIEYSYFHRGGRGVARYSICASIVLATEWPDSLFLLLSWWPRSGPI